jgi:dienelactone hydrolase
LPGIDGEGLLVQPHEAALAHVVVVPDADQTPEQVLGLAPGLPPEQQYGRRLAEAGIELIIPVLVSRQPLETADPQVRKTEQTNREWIYRQAYHLGRHIIGYEVQKVQAAVDWIRKQYGNDARVGVTGFAEGGLIAFQAAALDDRIDAVLVSGYFDSRERVWSEPIYRNVWSLLRRFGDAEVAALISPRQLIVEHAPVPAITGHKGDWKTPEIETVRREFARIPRAADAAPPLLITGPDGAATGPLSIAALQAFVRSLCGDRLLDVSPEVPNDARRGLDPQARQRRTVQQLEDHVQRLVREADRVRERFFLQVAFPASTERRWNTERDLAVQPAEAFVAAARPFREQFYVDAMGRFDEPLLPPAPRSRKLIETNQWTAYDVVLDVWPDVFAWGVLVLPKGIAPGERRPVVVCQHGRNGVPRDTVDHDSSAYNQFAARLAERGFITFAPHNLYRGEDEYRWLSRKANTVQATLFSFIIAQHEQILRWLETLPFVDGRRMAFYGLSYGGETAVRVPPILEKYCLSICSGDFNQWTRKVAATDQDFSFMRTIEWEMPYWNLGQTFDYAEMAYLMVPRPFMVERGHLDLVGRDAWVAHEYAKVAWLYAQLGLADRTAIEFFQGGHSIRGEGTFEFLHRHLNWPAPESR